MRIWCLVWFMYSCAVIGIYFSKWCITERIIYADVVTVIANTVVLVVYVWVLRHKIYQGN